MGEINIHPNRGLGLNLDSTNPQKKPGSLTFALNALVSSFDGNELVIQNEESNVSCLKFPDGYKVIGVYSITQINRVVYFLTDPTKTKPDQIGYTDNNDCTYHTLVSGECLNFDISRPILQLVVKSTNCGYSIYWTDGTIMRYLDFEDLPWKEVPNPDDDYNPIKVEGELDCNKLMAQPKFSIPDVEIEGVVEGGNISEGSYQFVVQYANELGESYTSFYNPTNPISIKDVDRATEVFDLATTKAISVKVNGLDNTGLFDYFNLIVIETINGISTNRLIGTYPISNTEYSVVYDGLSSESIQISSIELFQRYPAYDMAEGVTTSDDRLIWYGLKKKQKINYQPIWAKVKLYWESYQIPYNQSEGYYNPDNTYLFKGYMRDEVYPVEACFLLDNGEQTDNFLLIGRQASDYDRQVISNLDTTSQKNSECETPVNSRQRWEVYNTASVLGTHPDYEPNNDCYKGPYQYGDFAYWESTEKYPNSSIWGDLSNTPIRHFKFPDELISPRFSTKGDKEFIHPVGIRIDIESLRGAIDDSDLTEEEKGRIVGFKVFRGDRSSGNMSIKAKGHFTNVGKYSYETQEYYFANYPYNSVGPDPLFAIDHVEHHSGYRAGQALRPFDSNQGKDQFAFHSPDTHFGRVGNIDGGYVKLEAIDYGEGSGRFVKVNNNAEYKFTTQRVIQTSAVLATGVAFDVSRNGSLEFNGSDFAQVFNNTQELIEKLVPYENLGYNIDSVANFNQTYPIPNDGFKIRNIDFGKYIADGYHSLETGKILNHFRRESAVYLNTSDPFKYAHEYSPLIPEDNSRFIYSNTAGDEQFTDREYWALLQETDYRTVTAWTYGLYEAASTLAGDDGNLRLVLMQYLTLLLEPYLQAGDYDSFLNLRDKQDDCNKLGDPSIPLHPNTAQSFQTKQDMYVIDPFGEEMTSMPIGDGTNGTSNLTVNNNIPQFAANEEVTFTYYESPYDVPLNLYDSTEMDPCIPVGGEDMCRGLYGISLLINQGPSTIDICGGDILTQVYNIFEYAKSAYSRLGVRDEDENLTKIRQFNVNAYYGALKQFLPRQWGQVYSYQVVDTGFYSDLSERSATIFGGDTFINKFSFKTKLPVFNTTLVNQPDQKDVALDEEGTLGNPMFYISTKPHDYDYKIDDKALATSFEGIGVTVKNKAAGSVLQQIGGGILAAAIPVGAAFPIAGVVVAAVGAVIYLIGTIFSNIGNKVRKAMIKIYKDLLEQIINNLGIKNINLDANTQTGVSETGLLYQYVYGIPEYFVESQVNVDYRQATNDNEGNFYPRVGTGIPEDWLQEDRVPIIFDNTYHYNKSFSKQNKETPTTHLPETFDPNKLCSYEFPNRAFWSEKTSLNETLNNWLIYKPVSRYDFPKSFGDLTSLDGILNRQVIARFTNKTQIYNALTTVNTNNPLTVYLGNSELFSSAPPIDLTETDTGSIGSQHKFMLKTPHGIVFTDVKRGQVILLTGTTPNVISNIQAEKWFKRYLGSNDLIDNHFNGEGITGVYDEFYDRLLITKLSEGVVWTLSFSFKTNTWVSWHSYTPNFYIPHTDYFQTSNNDGNLWDHNKTNTSFCEFYGSQAPYIVEYPYIFKAQDEVVQSFKDYTVALRYEDYDTPVEEQNIVYFNKAIVYNNNQTTGVLNLIPKPQNNLQAYRRLVKFNPDSKDILLAKTDHFYNFNNIIDITKDRNKAIFLSNSNPVKQNLEFDPSNLTYGPHNYNAPLIRAKDARVRLILDDKTNYKLLSHINLLQTQISDL